MSLIDRIIKYELIRFLHSSNRRKRRHTKLKNWHTELPVFQDKVNRYLFTIKHANSIEIIIKNFEMVKLAYIELLKYKRFWTMSKNIFLFNILIRLPDDIDYIKKEYVECFLNERIDLEIRKSETVKTGYIKEKYIRRSIDIALSVIKYYPDNDVVLNRIVELEDLLLNKSKY